MAPQPPGPARSVSARIRTLSAAVNVRRRRGRSTSSGDAAGGAVSGWRAEHDHVDVSPVALQGKLPGGSMSDGHWHGGVRHAVRAFAARYNAEWLIEKNGFLSPLDARAFWLDTGIRRAA